MGGDDFLGEERMVGVPEVFSTPLRERLIQVSIIVVAASLVFLFYMGYIVTRDGGANRFWFSVIFVFAVIFWAALMEMTTRIFVHDNGFMIPDLERSLYPLHPGRLKIYFEMVRTIEGSKKEMRIIFLNGEELVIHRGDVVNFGKFTRFLKVRYGAFSNKIIDGE